MRHRPNPSLSAILAAAAITASSAAESTQHDLAKSSVVTPHTRFVLGRLGGQDRPLARSGDTPASAPKPMQAGTPRARTAAATALTPPPHVCGVEIAIDENVDEDMHVVDATTGALAGPVPPTGPPTTRVVEVAVETDYEFFALFGDADAAADYIVDLYGEIGAIYLRDTNTRIELTFVRIWDTPEDLFNEPNPLSPFVDYWNKNMIDVPRDAAQLVSGRRDLPWGGVAYVGALCGDFAYSVVGYILGFFPDPAQASVWHYDIMVCAHELGHNLNALHTHNYKLDDCDQLANTPSAARS